MSKIDVTQISGYEQMTAEEKLKALEEFEIDDKAGELAKVKEEMSKRNAEVSELKKQLKAKLSEDELAKAQREEEVKNLKEELEILKKKDQITSYENKLISLGYSTELAKETAEAYANGESDKVFANQAKFVEAHDKELKAQLLKTTPVPPVGTGSAGITLENFRKLPQSERLKYASEHPQEYEALYGGKPEGE